MLTVASSLTKTLVSTVQYPLGAVTTALMTLGIYSIVWPANVSVEDCSCYDYIIIGSGVGSVVANRLTENENVSVLLIENGKQPSAESSLPGLFFALQNTYQDYNMVSEKEKASISQSGEVFKIAAGKNLGGCSQIDHFINARGAPTDYDNWAKITNDSSWKYKNILPYFIKAENVDDDEINNSEYKKYHGTSGPITITRETHASAKPYLEAFEEVGQKYQMDINGNNTVGYTEPFLNIGNGIRQSTAQAYLAPIAKRSNLHVMYEAMVDKINFDCDNTATSVNVLVNGKTIKVNAAKEFILSAGVFNSPAVLQRSGVGPAKLMEEMNIDLVSDLPVGNNLQDHAAVACVTVMETLKVTSLIEQVPALTRIPFPIVFGAAIKNQSMPYPEYQSTNLIFAMNTPYLLAACVQIFGYRQDICEKLQLHSSLRNHMFSLIAVIDPKSTGTVKIKSTDPTVSPVVHMNYYSEKSDLERMVDYIENFMKIHNSTYFKSVNSKTINHDFHGCKGDFSSRDYIKDYAEHMTTSLYHQTSTCAMGSVVCSKLKVKGVKRLRVVDASVMPDVPRANPHASAVMIAEKASDMIKADMDNLECLCTPDVRKKKVKKSWIFG